LQYSKKTVKKGEKGDTFYFVEEGEAVATKMLKAGCKIL
jgi:hypothetical protein